MSYERKNITFYERNSKLTKNNTFNNVFVIQFLKNYWIFIDHGLFYREKYYLQLLYFEF